MSDSFLFLLFFRIAVSKWVNAECYRMQQLWWFFSL